MSADIERGFRSMKSGDLDLRPVFHHLKKRVRVHVLICMLACCLTWHLRIVWAPVTFTDQGRAGRDNPVAPARRSGAPRPKPPQQHDGGPTLPQLPRPARHLATLTRGQVRFAGSGTDVPMLTEPTAAQRQAFDLIGVPVPLTLK